MIFDCPRCDAENAVPASDIPAEGRVVQCIGCKQPFRVLPPEDDDDDFAGEEDTTHLKPLSAAVAPAGGFIPPTAGPEGSAPDNPFPAEEDTLGFPVTQLSTIRGAGGSPSGATRQDPADTAPLLPPRTAPSVPPNVPVAIPPGLRAAPPDLGTPLPAAPLPPDQQKGLGRRGRPRVGATGGELTQPIEDDRTPPAGTAVPRPEPAAEAAMEVTTTPRVLELARSVPLAVRVGAAVFVLTLFAAVGVRSWSRSETAPIAVEIAPIKSPPLGEPRALTKSSTLASPDIPLQGARAYVVAEEVRLRSQAGEGGEPVGRVRAGAQVRVLESVAGFTLILIGDKGPAGFVPASALGARMPLTALSEALEFSDCRSAERSCVDLGARGERRCLGRCEAPVEPLPGEGAEALKARCEEACSLARNRCERDCESARGPVAGRPHTAVKKKEVED